MNEFKNYPLSDWILNGINDMGFETPTPIQQKTIPLLTQNNTDIIALAQTGTGKTAAFGIPLLQKIDLKSKNTQALIIVPTRELCLQITNDIKNLSKYQRDSINIVAVYGGTSIENQIKQIKQGAQIIVATAGRLVDLIDRKAVQLSSIKILVLDEADEMLNMGFKDDIDYILQYASSNKQIWLFSATMPDDVANVIKHYMKNPTEIKIGSTNAAASNIQHVYYIINQSKHRYLALKRIIDYSPDIFGIIFCRTKIDTQKIADQLIKDKYNADALHGDLSQAQRDFVMKRFRNRQLQLLVATDVAARGIDVEDITHIINYDLPDDIEVYTHRSGRTARAGKHGTSIAIATPSETRKIKDIEKFAKVKFHRLLIPTSIQVCEKQLLHLVNTIKNTSINEEAIKGYLPLIFDNLKELSKEELIKKLVWEEFNRFYTYYQNAPDINNMRDIDVSTHRQSYRLFINLGALDGFNWRSLKDYIAYETDISFNNIRNIDVKKSFSFFEIPTNELEKAMSLNGKQFNNRIISVEKSDNKNNKFNKKTSSTKETWKNQQNGGREKRKRIYKNNN